MAKAVVIVDMLNDFVDEKGALPVKGALELVGNIIKIKKKAEEHGIIVVYANDSHAEGDPEFKIWPRHAVKGESGADMVEGLSPTDKDIVIEKQELSLFTNQHADNILKEKDVDELFLMGVATDYCVKESVLDALKNSYAVNVVVDAIAGVDLKPGGQSRALLEMSNAGAKAKTTEQVLEELGK